MYSASKEKTKQDYKNTEQTQKLKLKIFLPYKPDLNNAFSASVLASAKSKQGNGQSFGEYLIIFLAEILKSIGQ